MGCVWDLPWGACWAGPSDLALMTVFYWPRPQVNASAEMLTAARPRVPAPHGLRVGFTVGRVLGGAVRSGVDDGFLLATSAGQCFCGDADRSAAKGACATWAACGIYRGARAGRGRPIWR